MSLHAQSAGFVIAPNPSDARLRINDDLIVAVRWTDWQCVAYAANLRSVTEKKKYYSTEIYLEKEKQLQTMIVFNRKKKV